VHAEQSAAGHPGALQPMHAQSLSEKSCAVCKRLTITCIMAILIHGSVVSDEA
jgi:hypothetical protein